MSNTQLPPVTLAKDRVVLLALLFSLTFLACTKNPSQAKTEQVAPENAGTPQNTQSTATPIPTMTAKPTPSASPNANAVPSDDQIKPSITSIVKRLVTNNNYGWRTTTVSISNVEILRRGEFHPNEKFFLVQARVRGTKDEDCLNYCDSPRQRCEFEGTNDFKVYRDDYGDWKVDTARPPWENRIGQSCKPLTRASSK